MRHNQTRSTLFRVRTLLFPATLLLSGSLTAIAQNSGGGSVVLDLSGTTAVYPAVSPEVLAVAGTSNPGGGINLNTFLGADRYYASGITGQATVTTNMEAGHIWGGHETLTHVTSYLHHAEAYGTTTADLYQNHATEVGMLIGGRETAPNQSWQQGIAYGTDLRSAALASVISGPSFGWTWNTYMTAFDGSFGPGHADVVNSSYGYSDPDGNTYAETLISDAFSYQSSGSTTYVNAAGNSGYGTNRVGAPAAGYNTISVGALVNGGDNSYNAVAGFSSGGPQDFGGYNASGEPIVVSGVRAAVDIAAPGEAITSAGYGAGPSGYALSIAGTSFAAPLVAGGASLLASAAKTLPGLSGNPEAHDSMVIKALLLTGADKTAGWSNDLQAAPDAGNGHLVTTQALDWSVGAGRMNLDQTFDIQVNGTRDVPGTATGWQGTVRPEGWDYGKTLLGSSNDYFFASLLEGNSLFNTTLSWQRIREVAYSFDNNGDLTGDIIIDDRAQADLTLSFYGVTFDGGNNPVFSDLIAESSSSYNTVEHLSFLVPADGFYGLRVTYNGNTFDNTAGDVWGSTPGYAQSYGLAWSATAIPEPSGILSLAALLTSAGGFRKRRVRRSC